MEIKKVMIIGAGQMGSGIAQVHAMAGFDVFLHDLKKELVDKGVDTITKNLARQVEKGRMETSEKETILSRITASTNLENASQVDVIIEAATENMDVKKKIFSDLDQMAPPHTILATNTSSLPI